MKLTSGSTALAPAASSRKTHHQRRDRRALGAALALMIPSSSRERRLIGETSDEVKSSVRQAVEEKVEQAKDVVRRAA
jgi:hypothetical protein